MITSIKALKEEIFISTTLGDELVIGSANIAIQYKIDGRIEEVVIKNVHFVLIVATTMIFGRLLHNKGV